MKPGDKVYYTPTGEIGIVVSMRLKSLGIAHIVYDCHGKWEEYENYPSQITEMAYLKEGWQNELISTE